MSISNSEQLKQLIKIAKKTKSLDLSHLNLSYIPEEVYKLCNLESLSMSNNNIRAIAPSIRNLKSLKHLNLSNNKLERVPAQLSLLESLQSLNLSSNQLHTLPGAFHSLPWTSGHINVTNNPLVHPLATRVENSQFNQIVSFLEDVYDEDQQRQETEDARRSEEREQARKERIEYNKTRKLQMCISSKAKGTERFNQRSVKQLSAVSLDQLAALA